MSKLGEMLLKDGICTVDQLRAAVENQVILGGRIGTNLVELGSLSEETLTSYDVASRDQARLLMNTSFLIAQYVLESVRHPRNSQNLLLITSSGQPSIFENVAGQGRQPR